MSEYKIANLSKAFKMLGIYTSNNKIADGYNVHLPLIYQKLILSDFLYSSANVDRKVMIINLCEQPLQSAYNHLIYNFKLDDSEYISYQYFKMVMLKCCELLKMAETKNYPVIVNCAAGINRSSSVVVSYSFLTKRLPVKQAIAYIKYMKTTKYRNAWPTLTNYKFVEYLLKMQHEIINKSNNFQGIECMDFYGIHQEV
jgi:hypothetical protein